MQQIFEKRKRSRNYIIWGVYFEFTTRDQEEYLRATKMMINIQRN